MSDRGGKVGALEALVLINSIVNSNLDTWQLLAQPQSAWHMQLQRVTHSSRCAVLGARKRYSLAERPSCRKGVSDVQILLDKNRHTSVSPFNENSSLPLGVTVVPGCTIAVLRSWLPDKQQFTRMTRKPHTRKYTFVTQERAVIKERKFSILPHEQLLKESTSVRCASRVRFELTTQNAPCGARAGNMQLAFLSRNPSIKTDIVLALTEQSTDMLRITLL